MSENIQSIANGSFVLGNTNELTFSAGPGVKIDQPSEGVVRIGNDETVLYSGAYNAAKTSISLSESYKNFERVKIEWSHFGNKSEPIMEYGNAGDNFMAWGGRGSTNAPFVFFATWSATSDTSLQKNWCKYTNWGQTTAWSDANELVPVKVIGINRISGSNA